MENTLTTLNPQDGQFVSVVGDTYRILITGEQTGGAYAAIDMLVPPEGGPGPHSHAGIQESFFVLDGEIEVKTEATTYVAKKGAYINIPFGGMVHSFKNKSDKIAHLLCMVVPSGLEAFFMEIGKPVSVGTFLPPPTMGPEEQKQMKVLRKNLGRNFSHLII